MTNQPGYKSDTSYEKYLLQKTYNTTEKDTQHYVEMKAMRIKWCVNNTKYTQQSDKELSTLLHDFRLTERFYQCLISNQFGDFTISLYKYIFIYIYIHLEIKPNSVRIRF